MWTEQECQAFFKKLFGLEFTEAEFGVIWGELQKHHLTPLSPHGGNNIGFTPRGIFELTMLIPERTGSDLEHPRFKKIREEILPATIFALLLKKIGVGEHVIASSDVPDVALVKIPSEGEEVQRRALAIPVEAVLVSAGDREGSAGASVEEKIANVIIVKKFQKRYVKETVLLASLFTPLPNFEICKVSDFLIANNGNPFHQIWMFVGLDADNCVLARLTPDCEIYRLNQSKDLWPFLY